MALERRNPLPAGMYWQDVFEKDQPAFHSWLEKNAASVDTVRTESFPENEGGPAREWFLFKVTAPTSWEGPGFPTITTDPSLTSEDTAQRPPPEAPPVDKFATVVKVGVGFGIAFFALKLLSVLRGR